MYKFKTYSKLFPTTENTNNCINKLWKWHNALAAKDKVLYSVWNIFSQSMFFWGEKVKIHLDSYAARLDILSILWRQWGHRFEYPEKAENIPFKLLSYEGNDEHSL